MSCDMTPCNQEVGGGGCCLFVNVYSKVMYSLCACVCTYVFFKSLKGLSESQQQWKAQAPGEQSSVGAL